ncbi:MULTISPECIES: helix-turn-helix domain-containing protein [Staphylococcus]|uniref:Helix-turn-helix domain-containing protein n=2 Tax=Staphylococcus TaxID=1279 RepID=K9AVJ1_9STAP|nr:MULTISPECIES: XRE family transcriptional regulator [Staphylococcus]ADA81068.1 DNA-binding protein, putative [Staphylococcus aureus]ANS91782.1 HipB-like HTH protein [Staphylococcus aureus]EKU45490.1 helix-turn-helix domain-containing protein [Staphylococcus massiliensis S46]
MEYINEIIATNLRKIRNQKRMSLDDLSKLTSVSKAVLFQIEKGTTNPTISTLWKIAEGLNIPLSNIIHKRKSATIVRKDETIPLNDNSNNVKIYSHIPCYRNLEIFDIVLNKDGVLESSGHDIGAEELVFIKVGKVKVTIENEEFILTENEILRFDSNVSHSYENIGSEECIVMIVNHLVSL